MTYFSSAQAPKSIFLQRSEQKGLNLFSATHSTFLPQVGHFTVVVLIIYNPQSARLKGTFVSVAANL